MEAEHLVEDLERSLERADETPSISTAPLRSLVPPELLVAPRLKDLYRYALTDWAVIFASWGLMARTPAYAYPIWVFIIGGRIHALGVILHDLTHLPLRGKPFAYRVLEALVGFPIASTLNAMRYHHLRHHRDSGMPTDPYLKPWFHGNPFMYFGLICVSFFLVPVWIVRGPYGMFSYFIPKMRNSYAHFFLQDRTQGDLTQNPEVIACAREERWQVLFHLAVAVVTYFYAGFMLYHFFIPLAVAGLMAGNRVLTEHVYEKTADRSVKTILRTTVDHHLGPFGRLFFAPRNIGYHIVHHLHPQVGIEKLPALREWYLRNFPKEYPEPEKFEFSS